MATRYGHKWTSQYAANPAAADMLYSEWGETLAGLDRLQIARGFRTDAERSDNWPPSSPWFAAMCLGIPTLEQVKVYARRPAEGCGKPFMRLVWSFIDGFTFARAPMGQADRMLTDAFMLARANVLSSNTMPKDVAGLITKQAPEPKVVAAPEVADEYITKLRAMLHIADADDEGGEPG